LIDYYQCDAKFKTGCRHIPALCHWQAEPIRIGR